MAINTPDETPRVESKQAEGKKSLVAAKILEVMLRNRSALEDNPEFESVLEELKETFASEELQGIMSKIDEKQQEGSKDFKKNRKIKKITLSIVRKQEKLRS